MFGRRLRMTTRKWAFWSMANISIPSQRVPRAYVRVCVWIWIPGFVAGSGRSLPIDWFIFSLHVKRTLCRWTYAWARIYLFNFSGRVFGTLRGREIGLGMERAYVTFRIAFWAHSNMRVQKRNKVVLLEFPSHLTSSGCKSFENFIHAMCPERCFNKGNKSEQFSW